MLNIPHQFSRWSRLTFQVTSLQHKTDFVMASFSQSSLIRILFAIVIVQGLISVSIIIITAFAFKSNQRDLSELHTVGKLLQLFDRTFINIFPVPLNFIIPWIAEASLSKGAARKTGAKPASQFWVVKCPSFFVISLKLSSFLSLVWISSWASRPPGKAQAMSLSKKAGKARKFVKF